ncbi:MAG: hypothetical protein WCI74_17775, partial [Actinomycetes bacterium]
SLVDGSGLEAPDYAASMDAVRRASLSAVPTVVITSDHPFDFGAGGLDTWPAWSAAQDRFASALHAEHITKTDSGHLIPIEQPKLVTDAIVGVVDDVRTGATPSAS